MAVVTSERRTSLRLAAGPTSAPTSFLRASIHLHPFTEDNSSIRSVPELIEYNARWNPDFPFCVQARKQAGSTSYEFLTITHLQLKQAILLCSAWLTASIAGLKVPYRCNDGKVVKGPPVALLMESDVGLLINQLSLISLGVPVLLLSARLSPTAIHHLLLKTGTRAIIVSPRLQSTAKKGLSLFSPVEDAPTLCSQISYDFFVGSNHDEKSVEGNICTPGHYISETDRSVLILHSSGTTGLPKPIYTSHRYLLCFTVCHNFGSKEEAEGLNVSTLPLYHGFGLVTPLLSLGIGKTFCLPPSSIVPTGVSTVALLKATNATSLMSVPSILEEVSRLSDENGTTALVPLQFVAFGGGRLKLSVGEKLAAAGVRLLNHYGTTETGPLSPIFVPTPGYDWRYFRLRNDIDLHLEPVQISDDGVQRYKLITRPLGWETTFEIQDQLIGNPDHPKTDFNAIGRNDDLIALATGEKVNPRILENMLSESDLVKVAIAFGESQLELGIIVQPTMSLSREEHHQFKSSIWPIILEAGDQMDAQARLVSKDAIIVVPTGTVIPRSDKGSIMRKEVYKCFDAEIAKAYEALDSSVTDDSHFSLSMGHLEEDLKNLIQTRLNWRIRNEEWTFNDDYFELGMDSLQAVQLRRFLLSSLPKTSKSSPAAERITRDFVYQHPSIAQMARALRGIEGLNELTSHHKEQIEDFVKLYSIQRPDSSPGPGEGSVVLLTGSTGSLGSHLLAHMVSLPGVARVVCLNRPHAEEAGLEQDPYQRQLHSAEEKGIGIPQELWSKIQIFQTNSAMPFLGLEDVDYARLRGQVTHILHSAWPMDFKRTLPSFKVQFQTLQNLLTLARDAHAIKPLTRPKLLFVSSIAVVGQYGLVHGGRIVPEIPMDNEKCSNPIGYAQAKLVCERIIGKAVHDYGAEVDATYVRVGQMSGSKKSGFWNADEHFASLLKSSQRIARLPKLEGTFSWIPVDSAAQVLSDLLLTGRPTKLVYHLENPIRQSWCDASAVLASKLNLSEANAVPLNEWLDIVCATRDEASDDNPVKKLVKFFRVDFERMSSGKVILGTEGARQDSPTLRDMDVVSNETIAAYVDHWKSVDFLV